MSNIEMRFNIQTYGEPTLGRGLPIDGSFIAKIFFAMAMRCQTRAIRQASLKQISVKIGDR